MRQIAEVIHWATLSLVTTIIFVNAESPIPALILAVIAVINLWMLVRAVSRVTTPTVNVTQRIEIGTPSAESMKDLLNRQERGRGL